MCPKNPFEVRTDHKPLESLMHKKQTTVRLTRFTMVLQMYPITIKNVPGKPDKVAHSLSREYMVEEIVQMPELEHFRSREHT